MCGCEAQRASGPSVILRRQVVRLSISMSTQPRTRDTLNGQRPNVNKDKEQPSRKNTHGAEARRGTTNFFFFLLGDSEKNSPRAAHFLFRFARGEPTDVLSDSAVVLRRDDDNVGVTEAESGAGEGKVSSAASDVRLRPATTDWW